MVDFKKLLSPEAKKELSLFHATQLYFQVLTDLELAQQADYYLYNCSRNGLAPDSRGEYSLGHYDAVMRQIILPELMRRNAWKAGEGLCKYRACQKVHIGPSGFEHHQSHFCFPKRGDSWAQIAPPVRWSYEELRNILVLNGPGDFIVQRQLLCWTREELSIDPAGSIHSKHNYSQGIKNYPILWAVAFKDKWKD